MPVPSPSSRAKYSCNPVHRDVRFDFVWLVQAGLIPGPVWCVGAGGLGALLLAEVPSLHEIPAVRRQSHAVSRPRPLTVEFALEFHHHTATVTTGFTSHDAPSRAGYGSPRAVVCVPAGCERLG